MRVTILSREFPPAIGGIGDHTDRLATALTRMGHTASVVCAPPGEARSTYTVLPAGTTWRARDRAAIVEAVEQTAPDVIVWQYNPFSIGARGLAPFAPRLARDLSRIAPLTLSIHELWFPWGRSGARGVVWAVGQRLQARALLKHARAWVVTTEERDHLLSRIDATKTFRIPIGANVEPPDTPSTREQARATLGFPQGAFVVAHMGAVGSGRDLDPVFDAVRALRAEGTDARLLFAGRTGPFNPPDDLAPATTLTGTVPIPDLARALKAADAYVHADPVGPAAGRRGTLVAALAFGLPVVAYGGPDHASELAHGQNVLLVRRTSGAMTDMLRRLASDVSLREQIGSAAAETYRVRFAWDCIAEAFSVVLTSTKP